LLWWVTVAAGVVLDAEGGEALLRDVLAAALGANRRLAEMAGALREGNARLREGNARLAERDAEQAAELDRMRADLAVLQRLLFGWSSERSRPGPGAGDDGAGGGERRGGPGGSGKKEARPGGAGGAAGLLASAKVQGGLGFPGWRVLLPGVRGAVHAAR